MHQLTQGKIAQEILAVMIVVVATSAVVLFLVQSGILAVEASPEEVSFLNTEFIPLSRGGEVIIKEISFCGYVDEEFNCLGEGNRFEQGQEVHLLFIVETSSYNGKIMVVRNYQIKNPEEKVILTLDQNNNYQFELESPKKKEKVAFTDSFSTQEFQPGMHTLDILIENPLLGTSVTASTNFEILPSDLVIGGTP